MGFYVGPPPESSADAFDDLRYALDGLQGAIGEKIAPALLPIADHLARQIDQLMPIRMGALRQSLQQEPRRLPVPPQKPATGRTTRLVCRSCGDTPPKGATFCIECGASL